MTTMNGEGCSLEKKKNLITRNLQEVLGEDRLDAIIKERDVKVSTFFKRKWSQFEEKSLNL